jgi:hypothetical protein
LPSPLKDQAVNKVPYLQRNFVKNPPEPKPRERNKTFKILELTPDEIKEALVDYIRNKKRKE